MGKAARDKRIICAKRAKLTKSEVNEMKLPPSLSRVIVFIFFLFHQKKSPQTSSRDEFNKFLQSTDLRRAKKTNFPHEISCEKVNAMRGFLWFRSQSRGEKPLKNRTRGKNTENTAFLRFSAIYIFSERLRRWKKSTQINFT
jgi:hypothetical protein